MQNLKDKVAVITGAGSGIGRALALELAACSCKLALCDRNDYTLNETRRMAADKGAAVLATPFDVSSREDMYNFAAEVVQVFGCVDIVVNNAGMTLIEEKLEHTTFSDFEKVWKVNIWGVLHGIQAFLPYLKQRPEAALVNVASIFSTAAYPKQAPYVASKFAVRGLSETLRQELAGSGVVVTVVMPGGVKTNIVHNIDTPDTTTRDRLASRFDKLAKTSPETAARCIVAGIRRKQPRVLIGSDARMVDLIVRIFPGRYERIIQKLLS